ncbi:MAG: hypothetical protein JRM85_07015 [Nitrososphaerota archaeon]|nr:hypothetical protein [Nitrososphaerota archaeon]MDG6919073.1 hypothetical protein [Nitrososphaerota archaeon]
MVAREGKLEVEIESWEGFRYALRRDDGEAWGRMIQEIRERFGDAVERFDRTFATEQFFMALLLTQQKMIEHLMVELKTGGTDAPAVSESSVPLDGGDRQSGDVIGDHP